MGKKLARALCMGLMLLALPNMASAEENPVEDIISNSKKYMGVPYVFGGTTPNGFDCSGYIRHVYNESGISLPRTTSQQYNVGQAVAKEDLQKGDIVFFETYKSGPSHSGIYLGDGKFIHASSTKGVTISSINNPYYWQPRYIGARQVVQQVKGVADTKIEYNENHWAYEIVESLRGLGVVDGNNFNPEEKLQEGQAVKMLKQSLKQNGFSNAQAAAKLKNSKIIDNTAYTSKDDVTREKAAMMLVQTLLADEERQSDKQLTFVDFDTSHRGYAEVAVAIEQQLITGYADGSFKPHDKIKQSEFAVLVHRALNLNKQVAVK
ncbi:NlpC/P60 family protein [Bacillus tianshenii]|nr:NlpC/P60 family protein [Bacillus tianshenii]